MLPIPSFHHGWPNLKSICTPSPKLDSVISKVHVSQNMILTSLGENHRVYMHTLFKISTLYLQYIYILFTFNSHLDYAQSMAVWCLNWWLVEMFEVLSKSWSQNLPRHSSKLKKMRIIEFFRIIFCHTRLSTLFGHKIVSCESLKVSIVDMFHE